MTDSTSGPESAGRPIMTATELRSHQIAVHGRDYSRSTDGWSDMEVANEDGWHAVSGWGRDGYDLGDWPFVVISTRRTGRSLPGNDHTEDRSFQMRQTVEGDTTVYAFGSEQDRNAAIDYLFIWYGIGRDYGDVLWCSLAEIWDGDGNRTRDSRAELDAGVLRIPAELRGPFSWKRCDAEGKVGR